MMSSEDDEELAKRALSCHLPFHLSCQEMHAVWWSEDCWKAENDVLKLAELPAVPFFLLFAEGGNCPPDTWAAGVAPCVHSPALVVSQLLQDVVMGAKERAFTDEWSWQAVPGAQPKWNESEDRRSEEIPHLSKVPFHKRKKTQRTDSTKL